MIQHYIMRHPACVLVAHPHFYTYSPSYKQVHDNRSMHITFYIRMYRHMISYVGRKGVKFRIRLSALRLWVSPKGIQGR